MKTVCDKVGIKHLQVETIVGIHDWERQVKQTLLVDVELSSDFGQASKTDQLVDAVDYCAVAELIRSYCCENRHNLLESLVDKLASLLLEAFPCSEVSLSITKPGAIAGASGVSVSTVQTR